MIVVLVDCSANSVIITVSVDECLGNGLEVLQDQSQMEEAFVVVVVLLAHLAANNVSCGAIVSEYGNDSEVGQNQTPKE